MSDPAKDIATYLDAQGAATSETNLYYGKKPATPGAYPVATVLSTGGFDPVVNADREQHQPTVQVIITGAVQGYDAARTLGEDIRDELIDPVTFTTADGFTYYGSYQQGDIEAIGYDENDRPEFSMNFRFYRRKDT
jgi:hypothetical protein